MSERGIKFREQWISDNIFWGMTLDGVPIWEDDEYADWPRKLADRCAADALRQGIERRELEEGGPPLHERISDAMADNAEAELYRRARPYNPTPAGRSKGRKRPRAEPSVPNTGEAEDRHAQSKSRDRRPIGTKKPATKRPPRSI